MSEWTIADFLCLSYRTGNLRFNLPVAMDPYSGTQTVTAFGPACPQQAITFPIVTGLVQQAIDVLVNGIYQVITPSSEDCELYSMRLRRFPDIDRTETEGLSINVVVPAGTKPGAKLPVAVVSATQLSHVVALVLNRLLAV